MTAPELIAVVGMAARMPQAQDVDQYWRNLIEGRDCLTDIPYEEVRARGEEPDRLNHPSYVRRRPLMPDMECFDARYFGMTPREAQIRDPQHRVFLETCHAVLEHAGYDPDRYPGSIGMYAGVNATRYVDLHVRRHPDLVRTVGELAIETGNHPEYVSTFTSYKLGIRGPSMTVATACSTSLVAIHLACQAIRGGECEMAIAGGVEVEWPYGVGYMFTPGGIYSSDGRCRPFDARAEGTVFGSGAGAVLLKRYTDAVADGDTIYALIRGSAVNNDGSDKVAFTAPSVDGQAACIAEALVSADVHPSTLSYVEAHGTATRVGDPIEVKGLTQAFHMVGGDLDTGYCAIGSVKSNVGHLGPAAGVAGFIKTALALHHEVIPPTINFSEPNPGLELDKTPFEVAAETRPWPRGATPRRAGVSSFGIGGTNAHLILEEAPPRPVREPDRRPQLLMWSATTPAARDTLGERLGKHLAKHGTDLGDAAHTLRVGRRAHAHRAARVVESAPDAVLALANGADDTPPPTGPLVFALPGQGAQRPRMVAGLYEADHGFRERYDRCLSTLSDLMDRDLRDLWLSGDPRQLAETEVAQPLLFAAGWSLADRLRQLGAVPDAVIGHSLGEVVAATVAGVFSVEDGLRVVAERGRLMQRMPRGAMLAVPTSPEDVEPYLSGAVSVAVVNDRGQVVLSGPEDEVGEVAARLAAARLRSHALTTSHAYHSVLMTEAADGFRAMLRDIPMARPDVPLVSCATGRFESERLTSADFWADQLVQPVRFADASAALLERHPDATVLETGPGDTLTGLIRPRLRARGAGGTALSVLSRSQEPTADYVSYLRTLGELWRGGRDLDWAAFDDGRAVRVPMADYPFERRRHYVERPVAEAPEESAPGAAPPEAYAAQAPAPEATVPAVTASEAAVSAVTAPEVTLPVATVPEAGAPEAKAPEVNAPLAATAPAPVATEADPVPSGPALAEVTWVRAARDVPARPAPGAPQTPALTLLPESRGAARDVLSMLQRGGLRPLRVRPAEAKSAVDTTLDFADRDAVFAYVGDLARRRALPSTVVHAVTTGPEGDLERELRDGFWSLLWLFQAMQRYRGEAGLRGWRLIVLTRSSVDVTGGEPIDPARAMLGGLLRTMAAEVTSLRCELVDIGARVGNDTVAGHLSTAGGEPAAAIRGRGLWLPALRPLTRPRPDGTALRRRGVYLITGGLGALGRFTAGALANSGLEPRLVLLGRSAGTADDPGLRDFVDDLVGAGAEVSVMAADVADEDAMTDVLRRIRTEFGALNGVFHAAGVAGDTLLELREREAAERVLRAKVTGALVLRRVLEDERDLDFVVHYGSRAALSGLVGSGDYAAANGFLDALARLDSGGDRKVVSVSWPGWAGAGMAVREPEGAAPGPRRERATEDGVRAVERRHTGDEWYLDEHRIDGRPVLPGTGYVDLVLAATEELGLTGDAPARLTDFVFTAPLVVAGPTDIRVEFRPAGAEHHVAVLSRAEGSGGWREHATAVVAAAEDEPDDIDLSELYRRLEKGVAPASGDGHGLVTFGPRWSNVRTLVESEGEYLVELALAEEYTAEAAGHHAHPALLDQATSAVPGYREHLPFVYREALFFRRLPAEAVAVVRRRRGHPDMPVADLDVYDPRGRQVARITGFTRRLVGRDSFAASLTEPAPATVSAEPAPPTVERAPAVGIPDAGVGPLLSPADGVAALLRVIGSAVPAHVTVLLEDDSATLAGYRLYEEGGPAPVVERTPVEPPPAAGASVVEAPVEVASVAEPSVAAPPVAVQPVVEPAAPAPAAPAPAPVAEPAPAPGAAASVEDRVAELWMDIIGETEIGVDDNFFDVGNSLAVVQLSARIRDAFAIELGVGTMFEASSVRLLSAELARLGAV